MSKKEELKDWDSRYDQEEPKREEYPDCEKCKTQLIEKNRKLICPACGYTQYWLAGWHKI